MCVRVAGEGAWTGIPCGHRQSQGQAGARWSSSCLDGYSTSLPASVLDMLVLAYKINGVTLPPGRLPV
jgi:hypothetical protein